MLKKIGKHEYTLHGEKTLTDWLVASLKNLTENVPL